MKKRILFITWSFSNGGGVEKILSSIINNLHNVDIDILEIVHSGVKLESINSNVNVLPPIIKDFSHTKKSNLLLKLIKKSKYIYLDFLITKLNKFTISKHIKLNYDIEVACSSLYPSFLLSDNPKSKKICWIHGTMEDLSTKIKFKDLQYKSFLKSDSILAISNRVQSSLMNLYPQFENKIIKVNNGYDFSSIISKSNEFEVNIENLILSVCRLDKNKNINLLIEACNLMKLNNKKFTTIIIGEGPEKNNIQKLINKYNLDDNVKLLGFLENPYPYMKNASVFCLTSFSEGFPTVLVESMTLGCPFISTKVSGTDELNPCGNCGILIDNNKYELFESLDLLLSNNTIREEKSLNCIKTVPQFTLEKQLDDLKSIFNI